ncbi:hypothetical protein J3E72DRAFT_204991 [Bipolaris maydis]|nr:hypothetical protein J3E72DRAFT_204991 [Bipolaris maydis]
MFESLPDSVLEPSSFPTPQEVRSATSQYAKQLFKDHDTLLKIVDRHENVLRRRWMKKSRSQKKMILLDAWPDMPSQHRPDIQAWRQQLKEKNAYMWPSINLEDLTKSQNMLILLHARGRYEPHDFVHTDLEQASFGEMSGANTPAFLNGYTMLFHNRKNPDTYGELVSWDDDEDAFEYMMNGVGMHPGHGLKALEIQQRIWSFLVTWCEVVLNDIPRLTASEIMPDPGPPTCQESAFTSLEFIAMEAPYRTPAHLDLTRLKAIAFAERNAKEDHLWALREDPSYFADMMQELSEHRQEMLLDTLGHEHPTMREKGRPLFWNRVLGNLVVESYLGFATFDNIFRQVKTLDSVYAQHKDEIVPERDLPPTLMDAFQNLRFSLDAAKTGLIQVLKVGLFASPPWREFCYRVPPQHPKSSKIETQYSPPLQDHSVKRIMPLFDILFDDERLFLFGLHSVTDEIERLVRSDATVRALISPLVSRNLSSLSMVSECIHQLHLFQPWARKVEDGMDLKRDELRLNYNRTFDGWSAIVDTKFEGSLLYQYADPTDGRFNYPVHRRQNRQNVEARRKAESNLDAFWAAVDVHYQTHSRGKTQHDMVVDLLSSDRTVQRTPEWTEPEKSAKSEPVDESTYQPFSVIFHDRTTQITGNFDRASIPATPMKIKTRGTDTGHKQPEPQTATHHQPSGEKKLFKVDKRTQKVFKALFHSPHNPDLPGEVPWLDFLHAMVAVGFSAEKAHGSAWNFFPKTIEHNVGRSIQFHEPHPNNKIPFHWARRYGRRLARAYGWTGDMFTLA